jgi:hypothetical protein
LYFLLYFKIFATFDQLAQARSTMTGSKGSPAGDAWNSVAIDLCRASRWHIKAFIVRALFARIADSTNGENGTNGTATDVSVQRVTIRLAKLFALAQALQADPVCFVRLFS